MTKAAVDERPHDRESIGDFSLLRQQLAKPQTGSFRGNRLKWPAVLQGRVRFRIPRFEMTGTAVKEDHNQCGATGLIGSRLIGSGWIGYRTLPLGLPQPKQLRPAE